ncbi:ferric siderophore ABC transporter substrate-binding protein [Elizabethkingia sp. HX WHF]|uniref:ferric siderophore ABC transporter substrate-binding protein n=1 Tax=Elizabethkingia TaxID=308865 RepID=UPI00099AFF77|nr:MULTISPECIES: ferric siderophore ABC transporter substrate-binding protein [Elizabethkingia]ATL44606.1 ferric siderophore ABC transporter substrate-binding protein [Elizabethkingia miricola]MCL1639201.1 ferric siderophore ABC transporter substrate-binding protein [Elizabethkingia bruuniana]MDX8564755.1 ferric siderophore ABC transporter substrate-binding protein [Elizabethkingia sp. HX WHF]OPC24577.1 ferric siderophore ABC transporter substrate-binding protein [Elizabethkingia bruuniana]
MSYFSVNKKEEKKDKLKSAVITAIVWTTLLLFIALYSVKVNLPKEAEVINTMLVNFGDNRNGNGTEEPKEQEGSFAPLETKPVVEEEPVKEIAKPEPPLEAKEKIITGKNEKIPVAKVEKAEKKTATKSSVKETKKSDAKKTTTGNTKAEGPNKKQGATGDGKGTAAIGNLLKGRGTKDGSQGDGGKAGNAGDPLGGDGNGDSKIGVDRKLTGYIPGTMGRGGAQPVHSCKASGSITLAYTVDKAGNVISVRRSGGISDPCIVSTSIQWVKQYVKAEKANFSSTGTYRITF